MSKLLEGLVRPSYVIPTTAYVTPCQRIALDGGEPNWADCALTLTGRLPLAGAALLRIDAAGEIALTTELRYAAPWLEPAIVTIDRQLRRHVEAVVAALVPIERGAVH